MNQYRIRKAYLVEVRKEGGTWHSLGTYTRKKDATDHVAFDKEFYNT